MKYISIEEAMNKGKGEVAIRGWVYRERGSNKLKFIVLRDSSNIIQCVISKEDVGEEKFKEADKLQIEASLMITSMPFVVAGTALTFGRVDRAKESLCVLSGAGTTGFT